MFPDLGGLIVVLGLTLIGALTAGVLGRVYVRLSDRVLARMPVVRGIYAAVKQIFETVLAKQSNSFREVVLVQWPREGMWTIAFVTAAVECELQRRTGGDAIAAYVPTTLLRTHTSSMQIRYMQAHRPPIRIIVPGRVYRRDDLDLTHSAGVRQIEGLAVGEGISLCDLKGTLLAFAQQTFAPTTRVRFRPSFFLYTEPSAEIDSSCWQCDGTGCAMCKKTGWIELGGCGMVHPAVFEAVGYDPERYTGFAFGIGIERIAILQVSASRHPAVLRERPAIPRAVPASYD